LNPDNHAPTKAAKVMVLLVLFDKDGKVIWSAP